MEHIPDMQDKTIVLVTGANGGIGFETAKILALSSAAYHVVLSSRSIAKGTAALSIIQSLQPKASLSHLELDISSQSSMETACSKFQRQFPRLDVLINNAGIHSQASTLAEQLRLNFQTNTLGAALMVESFALLLHKSRDPRLINVTSSLGSITYRTDPTHKSYNGDGTAYRASKAALNMLTVCQAKAMKDWGVKVFAYDPGLVVTNLAGEDNREKLRARGAGNAEDSAKGILAIVEGKRDGDVGGFLHQDGTHPW